MQSIGAIALDPKNSEERLGRHGRSVDAQQRFDRQRHLSDRPMAAKRGLRVGLPNSERIAKIVVSPANSDTVYAAVPGALWSDSADRGLYKTTDGGHTWNLILKGANLSTGCSTIAMDPSDPNVMLAGMWDFRRKGWTFRSGGDGPEASLRPADFFVRLMAARPGAKSRRKTAKVFRRNRMADSRSRSRPRTRSAFTRLSNPRTARSSFPMMAARPGTSATRVTGWSGVRFISPT